MHKCLDVHQNCSLALHVTLQQFHYNNCAATIALHIVQCTVCCTYISLHWHKQRQKHMSERTHIYGRAVAIFTFHPFSASPQSHLHKILTKLNMVGITWLAFSPSSLSLLIP